MARPLFSIFLFQATHATPEEKWTKVVWPSETSSRISLLLILILGFALDSCNNKDILSTLLYCDITIAYLIEKAFATCTVSCMLCT